MISQLLDQFYFYKIKYCKNKIDLIFKILNNINQIMPLTEVQKVLNNLRLKKAAKRAQLMEFRKTEPRLVLSKEEKLKMIANTEAAMREDKDDTAKWIDLRTQYKHYNKIHPVSPLFHNYSANETP